MYAVMTTGGKQYRVEAGSELVVERVAGDAGSSVTFDRVLLVGDGDGGDRRHAHRGGRHRQRHGARREARPEARASSSSSRRSSTAARPVIGST